MAYTTLVAGTTITASWANASVRDQVVTPFTDSTARASAITSPVTGMVSTLTTTKTVDVYNGAGWSTVLAPAWGVWTTYTPTFAQSATITKTVNFASWMRVGRRIEGQFHMTASSAGTAANIVQIGIPVAAYASYPNDITLGSGYVSDVSIPKNHIGSIALRSSTEVGFVVTSDANPAGSGYVGTSVAITIATGDIVSGMFSYMANTDV